MLTHLVWWEILGIVGLSEPLVCQPCWRLDVFPHRHYQEASQEECKAHAVVEPVVLRPPPAVESWDHA